MTSECEKHRGRHKVSFRRGSLARAALRTIRVYGERLEKKPTRAYRCRTCGRWFLTSMPEWDDDDERG